jgi:hypothetical protein
MVSIVSALLLLAAPQSPRDELLTADRAAARLNWAPIWGEAAGAGDVGCTAGLAEFRSSGPPGGISYSKYLTVWRRQDDGTWKFAADAGNPRPAPTR